MFDKPPKKDEPEFSLFDLIPDLKSEPVKNQSVESTPILPKNDFSMPPMPSLATPDLTASLPDTSVEQSKEQPKERNGLLWIGLAGLGLIVVPLIIVGFIALSGNRTTQLSQQELEASLQTPLATVVGITPKPVTAQPSAKAGVTVVVPTVNPNCPPSPIAGVLALFPCARTLANNAQLTTFYSPVAIQLGKDGHNSAGAVRYDAVKADAQTVLDYYTARMAAAKFNLTKSANGQTQMGAYQVAYYSNGIQTIQVVTVSINRNGPAGTANTGELIVRLNAS